jgi:hypothetical protein
MQDLLARGLAELGHEVLYLLREGFAGRTCPIRWLISTSSKRRGHLPQISMFTNSWRVTVCLGC